MLPYAVPLTRSDLQSWAAHLVPRWVWRVALPAAWLVCLVVAGVADDSLCTANDPGVCGPDLTFALAAVPLFATPVLLWWRPLAGCCAGVLFGALDVAYDDLAAARWAFGAYAVVCLLVAAWLVRSARAQRRAVEAGTASVPGSVLSSLPSTWSPPQAVLVAVLLVGSALLGLVFTVQTGNEREHLARAVRAEATVTGWADDDAVLVLRVLAGDEPRTLRTSPLDVSAYPVGVSVPVLVDPRDPEWVSLVAEPLDVTFWLTGSLLGLLLGVLVAADAWLRARRWRRLLTGANPARAVWALPDEGGGGALVFPADPMGDGGDASWVAAWLPVEPAFGDPSDTEAQPDWDVERFGRAWRGEDDPDGETEEPVPQPAVLLGDLRDGGWALLLVDEGALLPWGPLRIEAADVGDEPAPAMPGAAVVEDTIGAAPVDLPMVARPPRRSRLAAAVVLLAGFVAGLIGASGRADDTTQALALAVGGGWLVQVGTARLLRRVELTHTRLVVASGFSRDSIPWARVLGVRTTGAVLHLASEPDLTADVGPFAGVRPSQDAQDRAREVAAAVVWLRNRARLAAQTDEAAVRTPDAGWLVLGGYVVALLTAFLLSR